MRHKTLPQERRKSYRLKKSLTVVRCSSQYLLERNYLSMDISEDGICLLTTHRLEIGESIKLGIYLPEFKRPVLTRGTVMRRNETNDPNYPYLVGIKFTKISPEAYHQIVNHIRYYVLEE